MRFNQSNLSALIQEIEGLLKSQEEKGFKKNQGQDKIQG
jgi:hypothetical protein